MKQILFILFLCYGLLLSANEIKINSKTEIRPYTIKIEKIEYHGNNAFVYGKVKQQERFSYSISFEECLIVSSEIPQGVKGELIKWNDDKNVTTKIKTISDKSEEKFILEFPLEAIPTTGYFSLKIGTALNKNKTPLIIEKLTIQKK